MFDWDGDGVSDWVEDWDGDGDIDVDDELIETLIWAEGWRAMQRERHDRPAVSAPVGQASGCEGVAVVVGVFLLLLVGVLLCLLLNVPVI